MNSEFKIKEEYLLVELLKRRGFLIEYKDNRIYLSDNSHQDDWKYLNSILRDRGIGYCTATGMISVLDVQKTAMLNELFYPTKKGSVGVGSCYQTHPWIYLKIRDHANKIPVSWLEPNIAYYIKALSACGIYTGGCCDGNHKGINTLYIEFDGPVYRELHQCLWNVQLQKRFDIKWENSFTGIDLSKCREKQYFELYKAADFIYENRGYYQDVRKLAAQWMTKKLIKRSNYDELKNRFTEEFTALLQHDMTPPTLSMVAEEPEQYGSSKKEQ